MWSNLGKGAYKEVFKAFDQEEGVEVAWNQIRVTTLNSPDITRIHREIQILQSLRNENIINLLYSWRAPSTTHDKDDIFFITEFMSSGSLKGYIKKTKGMIKPKIIRNWCKQILNGLHYLHSRDHPIIHRDLKCENIFINGNNGQAKIGDLGLAVVKATQHLSSVLGTPQFMAPELYDEKYDEKVDIYAFGMVVLEIATKEYPYGECTNQAQIYRKVSSGIKPAALSQVVDPEIRAFIDLCIEHDPLKRPSAAELLEHPFFTSSLLYPATGDAQHLGSSASNSVVDVDSVGGSSPNLASVGAPAVPAAASLSTSAANLATAASYSIPPPLSSDPALIMHKSDPVPATPRKEFAAGTLAEHSAQAPMHEVESDQHLFFISRHSTPLKPSATCDVEAVGPVNRDEVTLKMVYHSGTSSAEIKFPFNLTEDTATDVVLELVKENLIADTDEQLVRRRIEETVRSVLIKQRHKRLSLLESDFDFMTKNEATLTAPAEVQHIPHGIASPTLVSQNGSPDMAQFPNRDRALSSASSDAYSLAALETLSSSVPVEVVSLVDSMGAQPKASIATPSSSVSLVDQVGAVSLECNPLTTSGRTSATRPISPDLIDLSRQPSSGSEGVMMLIPVSPSSPNKLPMLSQSSRVASTNSLSSLPPQSPVIPDEVQRKHQELSEKLTQLQELNLKVFDDSQRKEKSLTLERVKSNHQLGSATSAIPIATVQSLPVMSGHQSPVLLNNSGSMSPPSATNPPLSGYSTGTALATAPSMSSSPHMSVSGPSTSTSGLVIGRDQLGLQNPLIPVPPSPQVSPSKIAPADAALSVSDTSSSTGVPSSYLS
ncbi:Serine/threonine-protein kinase wnk4 [Kappamyces sp. JEL0680]|nr:Serine/threonine-protein kinase wnk4 [Kappamyces sp. JEL0680]